MESFPPPPLQRVRILALQKVDDPFADLAAQVETSPELRRLTRMRNSVPQSLPTIPGRPADASSETLQRSRDQRHQERPDRGISLCLECPSNVVRYHQERDSRAKMVLWTSVSGNGMKPATPEQRSAT